MVDYNDEPRTAFRMPFRIVTVGLSTINVPSTTGTNTKVPKNPMLLISVLAA